MLSRRRPASSARSSAGSSEAFSYNSWTERVMTSHSTRHATVLCPAAVRSETSTSHRTGNLVSNGRPWLRRCRRVSPHRVASTYGWCVASVPVGPTTLALSCEPPPPASGRAARRLPHTPRERRRALCKRRDRQSQAWIAAGPSGPGQLTAVQQLQRRVRRFYALRRCSATHDGTVTRIT